MEAYAAALDFAKHALDKLPGWLVGTLTVIIAGPVSVWVAIRGAAVLRRVMATAAGDEETRGHVAELIGPAVRDAVTAAIAEEIRPKLEALQRQQDQMEGQMGVIRDLVVSGRRD